MTASLLIISSKGLHTSDGDYISVKQLNDEINMYGCTKADPTLGALLTITLSHDFYFSASLPKELAIKKIMCELQNQVLSVNKIYKALLACLYYPKGSSTHTKIKLAFERNLNNFIYLHLKTE